MRTLLLIWLSCELPLLRLDSPDFVLRIPYLGIWLYSFYSLALKLLDPLWIVLVAWVRGLAFISLNVDLDSF